MGIRQSLANPSSPSAPSAMRAPDPEILICGAGISGLALAKRLEQLGFKSIRIFEADESLQSRPQGYSLTIQQPGRQALKTLGLLDAAKSCSRWGGGGQHFVNALNGSVIRSVGVQEVHEDPARPKAKPGRRSNFYIPRQKLRALLAESLEATSIVFSEKIESYQESGDAVTLTTSSGRKVSAALLVGCDGVNSAVRKHKLTDSLSFLGVGMINGLVHSSAASAALSEVCGAGSLHLLDGTRRLFMKPFEVEGQAMWQLTFPADLGQIDAIRALPKQELHAWAMSETSSWCPEYQSILQGTSPSTLRAGGLYDRDPLHCARHSGARTAVIGDAAHPMTPFIGQGANQALTDSIQLAESLSRCRCHVSEREREMMPMLMSSVTVCAGNP